MSKVNNNNSANLTSWIPVAEAAEMIKSLLADGTYAKGEIKKSSCKWADSSDHSKGYLCRVIALKGLHPELEIDGGIAKRGRKSSKPVAARVEALASNPVPVEEPKVSRPKSRYTVDVVLEDGKYRQLQALEDDSAWFVVEDMSGEKVETSFGPDAAAALRAFYGEKYAETLAR